MEVLPSRKTTLGFVGGLLSEVVVFALWQALGFSHWVAIAIGAGLGVLWILLFLYYKPLSPTTNDGPFQGVPSPQVPTFSAPLSDSKLAAIRGGYASILIHLYSFEHWVRASKELFSPIGTREEYMAENPIQRTFFGRDLSTKEYMKRQAELDEGYENKVTVSKMFREYRLGIEKMKGTLEPAFEKSFPGQLPEVTKAASSYIEEATEMDKSMGLFGVFNFAGASVRTSQELSLVLREIERLSKVISKDESVMVLLNSLREEHNFMMQRVREVASAKARGLPF